MRVVLTLLGSAIVVSVLILIIGRRRSSGIGGGDGSGADLAVEEGDLEFEYQGVQVTVLEGPYTERGRATPAATALLDSTLASLESLRSFAARELLALYNENWLDEEHGLLDEAGFAARLGSPAVTLMDERGAVQVLFSDGGMFGGHYVDVTVEDGKPIDAALMG